MSEQRFPIPVTLVSGPPGSGKTTYVNERRKSGDVVIDVDKLFMSIGGEPAHHRPKGVLPFVLAARNAIEARLTEPSRVRHVWVIKGAPRKAARESWARRGAEIVVLAVPADECLRRIENDPERQGLDHPWEQWIARWWEQYELDDAETGDGASSSSKGSSKMNTHGRIMQYIQSELWAVHPQYMSWLLGTLSAIESIGEIEGGVTQMPSEALTSRSQGTSVAIAVIPVHGPISQRGNLLTMLFGGATTEGLAEQLQALTSDPKISAIVIDIDSPGGTVNGVPELGEKIRAMRGRKPIISVADTLAASAAYWLAAQTDEIVVSPSAEVGSIGVFALHSDISRALDQEGIKPTLIQFGENKTLGNPFEPLSGRARAEIQARVDDYGHMFVRAVAEGRRVTQREVMERYGQGLLFGAREAVRLGMADRVATLEEVLAGLGANAAASNGRNRRAELRREVQRAALG